MGEAVRGTSTVPRPFLDRLQAGEALCSTTIPQLSSMKQAAMHSL